MIKIFKIILVLTIINNFNCKLVNCSESLENSVASTFDTVISVSRLNQNFDKNLITNDLQNIKVVFQNCFNINLKLDTKTCSSNIVNLMQNIITIVQGYKNGKIPMEYITKSIYDLLKIYHDCISSLF